MFTKHEYNAFCAATVCMPCRIRLFHSLSSRSEQVENSSNHLAGVREAPGWNFGLAQSVQYPGRSISNRTKKFVFTKASKPSVGHVAFSPEIKRPGRGASHLALFSGEVKNPWNCAPIPSHPLTAL